MFSKFAPGAAALTAAGFLLKRAVATASPAGQAYHARARYPPAKRGDDVDIFHTKKIPNPYFFLEDPDSKDTKEFVAAQNVSSSKYLSQATEIPHLRKRMAELYDYPKSGTPFKRGTHLFFFENNGLENQYRLMRSDLSGNDATCVLDPNKLREDGTAALRAYQISNDGRYLAYGVSYGGSDWYVFFFIYFCQIFM